MVLGRRRRSLQEPDYDGTDSAAAVEIQLAAYREQSQAALETSLQSILSSLQSFPDDKRAEGRLADYQSSGRRRVLPEPGVPHTVAAGTEAAISFTGGSSRERHDRIQRVIASRTGIEYHHQALEIGDPVLRPASVELRGIIEIAENPIATSQVHVCAGMLAVEAATGWSHAEDIRRLAAPQTYQDWNIAPPTDI